MLCAGPAGTLAIHHQSIVHRRGAQLEAADGQYRHMLKYNYWRSASPVRDWEIEPTFDPHTCYYGGASLRVRNSFEPFDIKPPCPLPHAPLPFVPLPCAEINEMMLSFPPTGHNVARFVAHNFAWLMGEDYSIMGGQVRTNPTQSLALASNH